MSRLRRIADYLSMLVVDHGLVRELYPNLYRLSADAYRSGQPSPRQLRRYQRELGIRTVVNLRGPNDFGSYRLERDACQQLGLTLVDFRLGSRRLPRKETIHEAARLFREVEYPVLMHCKAGADRVGLMSMLYLHLRQGRPIRELTQLHWKYGHFRTANTGLLDHFFDSYLRDTAEQPMTLLEWLDRKYDREHMRAEYRPRAISSFVVDRILRRE